MWNHIKKSPLEIRKTFSPSARLFHGAIILLICITLILFALSAPKFEDGFESGFSLWDGMSPPRDAPGSPSRVEVQAHDGKYSASFNSTLSLDHRAYVYHKVAPASTDLYARGYFYVSESGLTGYGDRSVLITFRAASDGIPDSLPVAYTGWRNANGSVKWYLAIWNGSGHEVIPSNMEPLTNHWYSVELHWREEPPNYMGEIWVDDVLACSSEGMHASGSGGVDRVRIGLGENSTGGPTVVYADSIAVGGSRIKSEPSPRIWFLVIGIVSAGTLVATLAVGRWRARSRTNTSRDEETKIY